MKRQITLFVALALSVTAFGTGWVYLGFYPFIYDADSDGWSYSSEPVIWHQDLQTGEWKDIGSQPESFIPDNLTGQVITFCENSSCWEGTYHGSTFLTEEDGTWWTYVYMAGGYLPDEEFPVLYSLTPIGLNKVLFITTPTTDKGFTECLVLEFTDSSSGTFSGAISVIGSSGNRILNDRWRGTFELGSEGP